MFPYFLFQVYPDLEVAGPLPAGSFLTCGNDNTLRIWNLYPHSTLTQSPYEPNVYSNELVDVVYIDADHLIEAQESLKSQQHHASLSNLVGSAVSAISGTGNSYQKLRCIGTEAMSKLYSSSI